MAQKDQFFVVMCLDNGKLKYTLYTACSRELLSWKNEINETFIQQCLDDYQPSGAGTLAHRLQHRTACKIQNGHKGASKWITGSEKVSTTMFLGAHINFC